jgi:hypothetical protein
VSERIRRFSLAEATAVARDLALAYASSHKLEGSLLSVAPDEFQTEKRGKTPVHWAAVFETVHRGVKFDGPSVLCINLESGAVLPFEAP